MYSICYTRPDTVFMLTVCFTKSGVSSQLVKKTFIWEWYLFSDQVEKVRYSLLKSNNIRYNTLGCWVFATEDSSTKCLMFQVSFFFHKILQTSLQKPFQFVFLLRFKITKMKIKSFKCPKSIKIIKKKIIYLEHQTLGIYLSHRPSNPYNIL